MFVEPTSSFSSMNHSGFPLIPFLSPFFILRPFLRSGKASPKNSNWPSHMSNSSSGPRDGGSPSSTIVNVAGGHGIPVVITGQKRVCGPVSVSSPILRSTGKLGKTEGEIRGRVFKERDKMFNGASLKTIYRTCFKNSISKGNLLINIKIMVGKYKSNKKKEKKESNRR